LTADGVRWRTDTFVSPAQCAAVCQENVMSDHSIRSSWSRFIATRGRSICVGRAAAARAAERTAEAAPANAADPTRRVEGGVVERASVAAWEDEGGATRPPASS
jgi:hypothetical protein